MLPSNSNKRSNFPTRPSVRLPSNSFPEDLLGDGKELYTQIQFVSYQSIALGGLGLGSSLLAVPVGGMILPIPKKINDVQAITWTEVSATDTGLSIAARLVANRETAAAAAASAGISTLGQIGSAFSGIQLNPFLFMTFQRHNFKEFSFSWTFAPKNARESRMLSVIINQFKNESLPAYRGLILNYPNLALIKIYPNDVFDNLKFKPCAVASVLVDYTGAGPSFFKGTKAPTVVNLTVNFKEIQLHYRDEFIPKVFPSFDPATGAEVPDGQGQNTSSFAPQA